MYSNSHLLPRCKCLAHCAVLITIPLKSLLVFTLLLYGYSTTVARKIGGLRLLHSSKSGKDSIAFCNALYDRSTMLQFVSSMPKSLHTKKPPNREKVGQSEAMKKVK